MARIDQFLFSAVGVVAVYFVLGVWLLARPRSRAARACVAFTAFGYLLSSVYAVSHGAATLLAGSFRPLMRSDVPSGRTVMVILGSSTLTAKASDGQTLAVLDRPAATRTIEAFRVYRLLKPEWVISSGGSSDTSDPGERTGTTIRNALVALGVPASQILVETASRNTRDEAVIVASMLSELRADHVVLVTTQVHMRRSLGAFRAAGIHAIPAIAREPEDVEGWLEWWLPTQDGFVEARTVVHEAVGIAYYAGRGWYK